jgi:hypothetical protein
MSWTNPQKKAIHKYKRLLQLPDDQYRNILQSLTGCRSATNKKLTNKNFELIICFFEKKLENKILKNKIPMPKNLNIKYWRNKKPIPGLITTRQINFINLLFKNLCKKTNQQYSIDYLYGIASQATNKKIFSINKIKSQDASKIIDAIKNKLSAHAHSQ